MNDSMSIAAVSLTMQQRNLEVIAGNLANMNTPGFKAARVNFSEFVQQTRPAGQATGVPATALGGVAMSSSTKDFATSAALKQTGSPMDLAINGRGFLEVSLPDGSKAYTRGGALMINAEGLLTTQAGHILQQQINVPQNMSQLSIAADGRVMAAVQGHNQPVELGRLDLSTFTNPSALKAVGEGVYVSTDNSGEALPARAGEDGVGVLVQGAVEPSNVQMNNEMVALMQAQRAYELSARVLQVADGVMAATNELLRR
jgi:flagellar basal-body rod protein FlgG